MSEEKYQATRRQRRCKHPSWVKISTSRITGSCTERCTGCKILRTTGGIFAEVTKGLRDAAHAD